MTEEQSTIDLAPLHVRHVEALIAERDRKIAAQQTELDSRAKRIGQLEDTLRVLHAQNLHQAKQIAAYDEDLAGHQDTIERREAEARELTGAPVPIKRKPKTS